MPARTGTCGSTPSSATRRSRPCRGERTRPLVRRSGPLKAGGSLNSGTRGRAASSPDNAGTGQHRQMTPGPASKTERCT
jgi:hypothetical protein